MMFLLCFERSIWVGTNQSPRCTAQYQTIAMTRILTIL